MSSGSIAEGLDIFDPRTTAWFRERIGEPTDVQLQAWHSIHSGKDVLVTAPTGSGKTLAAFLWALDALATEKLPAGVLSILYISPLKALNSDIRRNLLIPLVGLREAWLKSGSAFPAIHIATRSGDTSPSERRAFLREPPSILATTPESLAILLNSPRARMALSSVRFLVLDEIHALAPTKRGVFLMAQIERLALLAGDFRRVALSATVADAEGTALFAGGYSEDEAGDLKPRPVEILKSGIKKRYAVSIAYPSSSIDPEAPWTSSPDRWPALTEAFVAAASRNRTTLIFTNARRYAEKIAFLMNERTERIIAWAHHGSLSREVRSSVEERLKSGELPAVVATSSLELGIDVGSVDEVLLAGTPGSAAATTQRIGRAGHQLGAESRGCLYPIHGFDLLLAAAISRDVADGRLEQERRPRSPLDVLAQLILSMTAMDPWKEDELYRFFRRAESFHTLSRGDFDLVVAMLRGRYDGGRLAALSPRLERVLGETDAPLSAKGGVLPLLYRGGGVIPDRGSYVLKLAGNDAPLGELDEEFVWERRLGDTFSLGTRSWRIVSIDARSVSVVPWNKGINIVPFWRAENQWRSVEAMESVLDLVEGLPPRTETKEGELDKAYLAAVEAYLRSSWALNEEAASALALFLARQRSTSELAGHGRVVLEVFHGPDGGGTYCFLHTLRGGRVNAALGIALRAAADERYGTNSIEFFWDDVGILAAFPALEEEMPAAFTPNAAEEANPESISVILSDLATKGTMTFLRIGLESSGLFGAAFREAAGRALLLPKAAFGKRTPLWLSRLRSRRLYDEVRSFADFPIVKEAWRTCVEDELDVGTTEQLVADIACGRVEKIEVESTLPSPLARGSVWIASDGFMYRRDEGSSPSSLSEELLGQMFAKGAELPRVDEEAVDLFVRRLKRLDEDYLPRSAADLADWLDERVIISEDEWEILSTAVANKSEEEALLAEIQFGHRLSLPKATTGFIASNDLPEGSSIDLSDLFARWLRYEGPVTDERIVALFGEAGLDCGSTLLDEGAATRILIRGSDAEEETPHLCDAELASRLLRFGRAQRRRAAAATRPLAELQALVANRQGIRLETEGTEKIDGGIADVEAGVEGLRLALEPILGSARDGDLWEREIFPARAEYQPYHLELLLRRSSLIWYGAGNGKVGFSLRDELEFSDRPRVDENTLSDAARETLSALRSGPASIAELSRRDGMGPSSTAETLRELAKAGLARTERFLDAVGPESQSPGETPHKATKKDEIEIKANVRSALAGRPFGRPTRPIRRPPTVKDRWSRDSSSGERWMVIESDEEILAGNDALDADERSRALARRLLARYGALSRSILGLEEGGTSWSSVFRSLRLMEFAGEVVGGRFYEGLDELQFVPSETALSPRDHEPSGLYCLCARDPASLCGLQPLSSTLGLPSRLSSNHVVWRGSLPILVSRRNGRALDFRVKEDHPDAIAALKLLARRLRFRAIDPVRTLIVETVGDVEARHSPHAETLRAAGFVEALRGFEFHALRA